MMRVLLTVLCVLASGSAWAQTTIDAADRVRVRDRMVVGVGSSLTFGEVMRIIGSPTVSSGTGTMNPFVLDADGDGLEDSNTTVSTAGAWTWGAAGSFTSTLGITGNLTGNTGTLLLGSDTRITNTSPLLWLHDSDAASSEKYTGLEADAGLLSLNLCDDTPSACNAAFKLDRTGIVPDDWRWGSLLGTVRPENNGGSQLGSLLKQYSTAYIWDLVVGTLTAKEVISTIGGEVIVAPTTALTRDAASGDTVVYVKHNQPRTNDTLYLKVNGSAEKMLVTSDYTDCNVSGNCASLGPDFRYSVTRNRSGTGAKNWIAGAAVVNEGNTGDGFISMYADRSSSVSDGYIGQVITDGPAVYFRMNDDTSTQSFDTMGSGLAAAEGGTQSAGLGVDALAWSSVADPIWENTGGAGYLTVADAPGLKITGDLTIELFAAWQRTTSRDEVLVSRQHTGEYFVRALANGTVEFCHGNGTTSTCVATAAGVMPTDTTTHHYAFVRDSVSSPKRILFYKDGALHTSWTYTQALAASSNPLYIGGDPGLGVNPFDGYLDEVAVYNYQLPADRIALHYAARANAQISKFTIGPTLCGNVRTGTAAFDLAERWCLGNLAGTYDYSSVAARYGLAAGSVSGAWFGIDATSGLRGMFGSTQKFGINASGVASFVEGAVTINDDGLQITPGTAFTDERAYTFADAMSGGTTRPGLYYREPTGTSSDLYLRNDGGATIGEVFSYVESSGGHRAYVLMNANSTSGLSRIQLAAGDRIFFNRDNAGSSSATLFELDLTNSNIKYAGSTGLTSSFTCGAGEAVKGMNVSEGGVITATCGAP